MYWHQCCKIAMYTPFYPRDENLWKFQISWHIFHWQKVNCSYWVEYHIQHMLLILHALTPSIFFNRSSRSWLILIPPFLTRYFDTDDCVFLSILISLRLPKPWIKPWLLCCQWSSLKQYCFWHDDIESLQYLPWKNHDRRQIWNWILDIPNTIKPRCLALACGMQFQWIKFDYLKIIDRTWWQSIDSSCMELQKYYSDLRHWQLSKILDFPWCWMT